MKNLFVLLGTCVVLAACGSDQWPYHQVTESTTVLQPMPEPTPITVTVTVPGTPVPTPVDNPIADVINQANSLRDAQGQTILRNGLTCTLYTVPTSTTQIVGATGLVSVGSWSYIGSFQISNASVTNGNNTLPTAMQSIFQSWYIEKCTGYLVNIDNAYHVFSLTSDDGANLYVDGLLVNNDGLHSVNTVSNDKLLSEGIHNFEIDYFQASGNEALVLNEDGNLLSSTILYH